MRVSEEHRAPALDEVDVAVAVDVRDVSARRAGHEEWMSFNGIESPNRGGHPAGHQRLRFGVELVRARPIQFSHSAAFFA
jgi:hypothetical protein